MQEAQGLNRLHSPLQVRWPSSAILSARAADLEGKARLSGTGLTCAASKQARNCAHGGASTQCEKRLAVWQVEHIHLF